MAGEVYPLRMATQTGRKAGDDAFITEVEKVTGGDLSKGAPGHLIKR